MNIKYYIAYDDGNILIKCSSEGHLSKYDDKSKLWLDDDELYRIYFGDMPVKELSEKEALKRIGELS